MHVICTVEQSHEGDWVMPAYASSKKLAKRVGPFARARAVNRDLPRSAASFGTDASRTAACTLGDVKSTCSDACFCGWGGGEDAGLG